MRKFFAAVLLLFLLGLSSCHFFGEKPPQVPPESSGAFETGEGGETGPAVTKPAETGSAETGPTETSPAETSPIETAPDVMVIPAEPGAETGPDAPGPAKSEFGSAGRIEGKTLLISVFASDTATDWDFSRSVDNDTANDALNRLLVAADWLEAELEKFDVAAEFIADWRENPDLVYSTRFSELNVVADGSRYWDQARWAEENIPGEDLKAHYGADNIIYLFFYNTDFHNQINSYTFSDSREFACEVELIDVFVKFDYQFVMPAASYAHEILHTFGAKDLYLARKGITPEYVDYCRAEHPLDIMYSVNEGPAIEREISPLDAYYIGVLPDCEEVARFNLETSYYLD